MKRTTIMTGAAAAALVALTAAAPAQAQYYPYDPDYRARSSTSDIIRGVATAAAAAAAVGAISNAVRGSIGGYGYPQRGYGYPQGGYGYPQGGYGYPAGGYGYPQSGGYGVYGNAYGERAAVDVCANQAQRSAVGGRVSITDVDRRGSRSYRVRGVIDGATNGYGYGYNRYNRYERYEFSCTAREDGRITDFDLDRD